MTLNVNNNVIRCDCVSGDGVMVHCLWLVYFSLFSTIQRCLTAN